MNYNIPYYGMMPMATMPARSAASGGLFSRLLGGFNVSSLLSNTQKTLNLVNQAIPIVKQINPLVKNAKTMFRVMNEFKKVDSSTDKTNVIKKDNNTLTNTTENNKTDIKKYSNQTEGPVFFIN